MIETAAVVPHPPVLVAELAGSAAAETAAMRAACVEAARALAASSTRWLAVGAGPEAATWGDDTRGTFAGFGADVVVALGPAADSRAPDRAVPLPLLVAGWLREACGDDAVAITGEVLPAGADPDTCARVGARLAAAGGDAPVGLLVLGDGAATHTARAPGTFDERAAAYDDAVADALATGDAAALAALDPDLSDRLWVGGRVPWQVLAAAMPRPGAARLLHSSAPFGVAYHVAVWTR